ncbi:hypothetical protein [Streptomyces longispororuber]|uniref:hypothetical protein n=1 Tax=Streptomyces longispororuber TaxID=68230 RepID=UPI0036F93579
MREQAAIEAEDLVGRRKQARAERARRETARAAAQERVERERQAAAAADAVRQALERADCEFQRSDGLCEVCGFRRRTEALMVEAGLVAAAGSADLFDPADVAAVTAHVRASLEADIERARREFLELVEPGALEKDPVLATPALAFAALQAVEQALTEHRSSALERLGRTEEAEAEAQRTYRPSRGAAGTSTTRTARTPSPPRRRPPTPPENAPHSTCLRLGWSNCACKPPPGPGQPRPRRGQTTCPSSPRARWTATHPGR